MGEVKQINIKNGTYYCLYDIIDLKKFHARFLRIDKRSYKNNGIYNIGYIRKKKLIMQVDILKQKMKMEINT